MRKQFWITGAAGVAVIAAVVGTVVALGQGGDEANTAPTGERTLLRVQADSEATCGATLVASIYLDDLEIRPSPYDDTHAAGLVAFELPLVYDPAVLQVGDASNIVLNDALDEVDSDGDGVTRNWIPASYINDREGWAMVAGTSYNTNSNGDERLNHEEGLVPSQSGTSFLLATVHFSVIGEGESTVGIESGPSGAFQREAITLYDPDIRRYDDVGVKPSSVTATGGDCGGVETSTPIPTRVPVETPTIPPTRAIPSPQLLTPNGSEERPDCLEAAYVDPEGHFSLCYLSSLNAIAGTPGADLGTVLTLKLEGMGGLLTAYWRPTSYFTSSDSKRCTVAPSWDDAHEATVEIVDKSFPGCSGSENQRAPDSPEMIGTFVEIPGEDGFLTVIWYEPQGSAGADARDAVVATLDSLIVGE